MPREITRAKWLLGSLFVFFVSGCISWTELVFLFTGQTTLAKVDQIHEATRWGRNSRIRYKFLSVGYSFTEPNGRQRSESDSKPLGWSAPDDGYVMVRYTPGKNGFSRLSDHVEWAGLIVFACSAVLLLFFAVKYRHEAVPPILKNEPADSL